MGNQQGALSGIHPFKDPDDPAGLPAPPLIQFPTIPSPTEELDNHGSHHHPQQVTIGPASPRWIEATQGNKFDELFVMKAPTPPPRRPSEPLRGSFRGKQTIKSGFSLRNLPKMISRPDLNKIGTLLRWKKKRKSGEVYPVPPDAQKPSSPSKPEVYLEQDEYFMLRWDPPAYDGGLPIIGYIIQHLELGLPQVDVQEVRDETQSWYSSEPGQVTSTEVLLNNLIEGTTYQFRIIAENLLGYSPPGELSDPIVFNPRGILNDYFCPPILIIPLDETYNAIEHERLVLSIEITGQPYPIVKWYDKNEGEIGGVGCDPRFVVTSCGQKRMLTIAGVECSDTGAVKVVGENEKGSIECKTTLIVEAPPHIRRVQRLNLMKSEDPLELPKDDQKLLKRRDSRNDDEVIFQSGELANFKFMWSASPYPNICVYHEGELIDGEETGGDRGRVKNDRVSVEVTQNLISVKINIVHRTDRGEWLVRLDNALGEDSANVLVTVTDRPSRTGKPDVLQLSDNTVILKWDKPQDDGGCPVQGYIIEYYRSEWGVWLKACTTKNPYTKIRDLIPGSKYKFRVKAENLYGVSEPSIESVELLITDLASTLRSVDADAAGVLMTTVEEEEEEAVHIEEEEPGTGDNSKPTPPRRRFFDRGSTASIMRVSTSTMTDLSAVGSPGKGAGVTNVVVTSSSTGLVDTVISQQRPKSPILFDSDNLSLPHQQQKRSPSPSSAKFLSVSFQPQVILLPDDADEDIFDEDILRPPEIVERRSVSPAPDFSKRFQNISSRKSPDIIRHSPSPSRSTSPLPMNIPAVERSPSPKPIVRTVVQRLDLTPLDEPLSQQPAAQVRQRSPITTIAEDNTRTVPIPPRRHVHSHQQQPHPEPPIVVSSSIQQRPPISSSLQSPSLFQTDLPKKLYSRSEIIKSAATNELDFYYYGLTDSTSGVEATSLHEGPHEEEPEEDPELLKVKEALKNDTLFDDLEDEEDEEYEYDFDKLREEYEEDKKKGMVSRQDSGVSGKSVGTGRSESLDVEEEPSYSEELLQESGVPRAASIQAEQMGGSVRYEEDLKDSFRAPFERAQSEVVGTRRKETTDFIVETTRGREQYRAPPSPHRPPQQRSDSVGGGSRSFLTDRFTDYIAMKASSRNKAVGSSLRSLSSGRYSSNENVGGGARNVSRDSGRSSMVYPEGSLEAAAQGSVDDEERTATTTSRRGMDKELGEDENIKLINSNTSSIFDQKKKPFTFREFKVEEEVKVSRGLEGSRSSIRSSSSTKRSISSLPYDLIHPVQNGNSRKVAVVGERGYDDGGDDEESQQQKHSLRELDEEKEQEEQRKRSSLPPISTVPNRFISNPDIFLMMSVDGGGWGRQEGLEHSKSETNFDTWIPDSVLKMRAGSFIMKGGVGGEDTTEEDYSYGGEEGSGEEGLMIRSGSHSDKYTGVKRTVSFGDTDEEISFEEGLDREKHFGSGYEDGEWDEVREKLAEVEEGDDEGDDFGEELAADDEENSFNKLGEIMEEDYAGSEEEEEGFRDEEELAAGNDENSYKRLIEETTKEANKTEQCEYSNDNEEVKSREEESTFYYEEELDMELHLEQKRLERIERDENKAKQLTEFDDQKEMQLEKETPAQSLKPLEEKGWLEEEKVSIRQNDDDDEGAFYYEDEEDRALQREQELREAEERRESKTLQTEVKLELKEEKVNESIEVTENQSDVDPNLYFKKKPLSRDDDDGTFYYEDEEDQQLQREQELIAAEESEIVPETNSEIEMKDGNITQYCENVIETLYEKSENKFQEAKTFPEDRDEGTFFYEDEDDRELQLELERREVEKRNIDEGNERNKDTKFPAVYKESDEEVNENIIDEKQHDSIFGLKDSDGKKETSTFYYEDEIDIELEEAERRRKVAKEKAESDTLGETAIETKFDDIVDERCLDGGLTTSVHLPKHCPVAIEPGEDEEVVMIGSENLENKFTEVEEIEYISNPDLNVQQHLLEDAIEDNIIADLKESFKTVTGDKSISLIELEELNTSETCSDKPRSQCDEHKHFQLHKPSPLHDDEIDEEIFNLRKSLPIKNDQKFHENVSSESGCSQIEQLSEQLNETTNELQTEVVEKSEEDNQVLQDENKTLITVLPQTMLPLPDENVPFVETVGASAVMEDDILLIHDGVCAVLKNNNSPLNETETVINLELVDDEPNKQTFDADSKYESKPSGSANKNICKPGIFIVEKESFHEGSFHRGVLCSDKEEADQDQSIQSSDILPELTKPDLLENSFSLGQSEISKPTEKSEELKIESNDDPSELKLDECKFVNTSVEIQDTFLVEDVVVEKVEVELDLNKIQQSKKQTTENKTITPVSCNLLPETVEDEIDRELLNLQMSMPIKSQTLHHSHGRLSSSEASSRRSLSIDRLFLLTPVQEESAEVEKRSVASTSSVPPSYRPTMSAYYERAPSMPKSSSLSSSRLSIYSSQSTITSATPTRATSLEQNETDEMEDTSINISEIRKAILQSTTREFISSVAPTSSSHQSSGIQTPVSRPSTPSGNMVRAGIDSADDRDISPFINYLFNGAFYLMLTPMLYFVDSLYLALVCLVVVACVHFFIIKF